MQTFDQARETALASERRSWRPGDGMLYAEPAGLEDARGWLVIVGAREWLVDGNSDYARLDDRVVTIDKLTGRVEVINAIDDADRIAVMTPTR